MKSFLPAAGRRAACGGILASLLLLGWAFAPNGFSQAPIAATTNNTALAPLLTKLKAQQDQMAANQTKIEAQTAALKEEIRQAKIYAGRSGGRR